MNDQFTREDQFTLQNLRNNQEMVERVLRKDYMTVSYLNCFEGILKLHHFAVTKGCFDTEVVTFRVMEDNYDHMRIDFEAFLQRTAEVLSHIV